MTVPQCSRHKTPMRAGKFPGTWYCPKKVGEDWCKERAKDGQAQVDTMDTRAFTNARFDAEPRHNRQEGPQNATGSTNAGDPDAGQGKIGDDMHKWQCAFNFAASVCHGTGNVTEALNLAAAARALLP